MRRALLASAAALAAGFAGPACAQIPVTDGASIAQRVVQQAQTMLQWGEQHGFSAKQLAELQAQLQQARMTYAAVTGVRDLGSAMYALNVAGVQNPLPVDPRMVADMIAGRGGVQGTLTGLQNATLALNRIAEPDEGSFRGQEMAANARSIAGAEALAARTYEANAERLTQLAGIRVRMATASDPAEVAQLHLAIAAAEADLNAQQAQVRSAQMLFTAAQASRAQRSAENEDRCLRIVVAYFQAGGGDLNCPTAPAAIVTPAVAQVGGTGAFEQGAAGGASDGTALGIMMSQPWGEAAVVNARSVGVTPEALAATCVIESRCKPLQSPSSSAGGPFQVIDGTWREQATKVGVSTDLAGKMDGGTSSFVAANYLAEQGRRLQQYGIDAPTVAQARALYQFGGVGMGLATAPDSAVLSAVMPAVSDATLRSNGITPGVTTAGEWRAKGRAAAGSAFDAPLFQTSNT